MGGSSQLSEPAPTDEAQPANEVTVGGFVLSGDGIVEGTDYDMQSNVLHIKSSKPMTIKNENLDVPNGNSIRIDPGVKADLTLAGVNISCTQYAPIELITNSDEDGDGVNVVNAAQINEKTTLYLTIMDGTTNTLKCTNQTGTGSPGIRCGWGSILVIDDEVTNIKAGGSKFNLDDIVELDQGVVKNDVTLLDGKTVLKAKDPIVKLDSPNPGTLTAQAGGYSAGIGSADKENAGTIVINGGNVNAYACQLAAGPGAGAGIGGGANGSGTVMIFNGGKVNAYASGSGCGTGIGAGLGFKTIGGNQSKGTPKNDAIKVPTGEANSGGYGFLALPRDVGWFCCKAKGSICPNGAHSIDADFNQENYFTVAGDITINGGLIYAVSGVHGNAFGQSCSDGPASNYGHVIRVTGGTLLTKVRKDHTVKPRFALGASFGYTIVNGGSVQVVDDAGNASFQGIGGTAYNISDSEFNDLVNFGNELPDSNKVLMVSVDLKSEIETIEGPGANTTVPITSWTLAIDGHVQEYGAPSYLDKGKLYLWVPADAAGKKISVDMSYRNNKGENVPVETLFVDKLSYDKEKQTFEGALLKRYIDVDLNQNLKYKSGAVDALRQSADLKKRKVADYLDAGLFSKSDSGLTKEYDGLGIPVLTLPLSLGGLYTDDEVSKPEGDQLAAELTELDDTNDEMSEVRCQRYDKVFGSPLDGADIVTDLETEPGDDGVERTKLPADVGVYKSALLYWKYGQDPQWETSFWGHRITSWWTVTPAPSAIHANDQSDQIKDGEASISWGHLAADGTWTPINGRTDSTEAGNRIRVRLIVRSGDDAATTCARPTGKVQLMDKEGNAIGSPIELSGEPDAVVPLADGPDADPLTKKAINDVSWVGEGGENREAVALDYYIDPTQVGSFDQILGDINVAGNDGSHKLGLAYGYAPEKNYIESKNDSDVLAVPVDPSCKVVTSEDHLVKTEVVPDAGEGEFDATSNVLTKRATVTVSYDAYKNADGASFKLGLESSSPVAPEFVQVGNKNAATVDAGADGVTVHVSKYGQTAVEVTKGANAYYNGVKYEITINVEPAKPYIQVRTVARNVTEGKKADDPVCPGDTVEYFVTGLNKTPGFVWKEAVLSDVLDPRLTVDSGSVLMSDVYLTPTPENESEIKPSEFYARENDEFYKDFDWDALFKNKEPLGENAFVLTDATDEGKPQGPSFSTKSNTVGDIKGGESRTVRFIATMAKTDDLVTRDSWEGATLPNLEDAPNGNGKWALESSGGDPGAFEDDSLGVFGCVVPVAAHDPVPGTDVTISKSYVNTNKDRKDGFAMEGDVLRFTVTVANQGKNTVWYAPVIRDALPDGLTYVAGSMTMTLEGRDGKDWRGLEKFDSLDPCYDDASRTIAVCGPNLYCGERVSLTFECEVNENASEENDSENVKNVA